MKIYRIIVVLFSIPAIILFVYVHIFSEMKSFPTHPIANQTGNIALGYSYDDINNEFPNRTIDPIEIQQPSLDQSNIILMGDSYSNFYDGESIYGYLTENGHVVRNHFSLDMNKTDENKVVFLIFGKLTLSSDVMRAHFEQFNNPQKTPSLIKRIFTIIFPDKAEYKYNYVFNRSYFTFKAANELGTLRHKLYGERSRRAIYVDHPKTILYSRISVNGLERDLSVVKEQLGINTKILLETEKNLKKKGYQLYIVIAPVKPEIIPLKSSNDTKHSHDIIAQTLLAEGLQVIDATPILKNIGPSSYTLTDSHWSSKGMKIVADSLSKVASSYQKR